MKAALEAWGSNSNLFHRGVAKESRDPKVIAAAMSKPGITLRRPVGSDGPFGRAANNWSLCVLSAGAADPNTAARAHSASKAFCAATII
jgi:methyl coenzyme M reductase subunit C